MGESSREPKREVKFDEVLAVLSERVDSGYYFEAGREGRMEAVPALQAELGCGRSTLRMVLAVLRDRGVIQSHQGARWVVVARSARRAGDGVSGTSPDGGRPDGPGST